MQQIMFELFLKIETFSLGNIIYCSLIGLTVSNDMGAKTISLGERSFPPHQRKLIAEINAPFKTDLVFMDGVDAFVDGGPATGKRVKGNVLLASAN